MSTTQRSRDVKELWRQAGINDVDDATSAEVPQWGHDLDGAYLQPARGQTDAGDAGQSSSRVCK